MKIGVSLSYGYLSGSSATEDERLFREAFGAPRDCLETLRAHGVGSIEIGRRQCRSGSRRGAFGR